MKWKNGKKNWIIKWNEKYSHLVMAITRKINFKSNPDTEQIEDRLRWKCPEWPKRSIVKENENEKIRDLPYFNALKNFSFFFGAFPAIINDYFRWLLVHFAMIAQKNTFLLTDLMHMMVLIIGQPPWRR